MMMVEMLVQMPDLRRRIQADHVADASGRCRDCPGTQWPCTLHQMATEADRRCTGSAPPRPSTPARHGHRTTPALPSIATAPLVPTLPGQARIAPPHQDVLATRSPLGAATPVHRVPPQNVPAQLPPQRLPAYQPAMPGSGPIPPSRPAPATRHSMRPVRAVELIDDDLPTPRVTSDRQPRHLIGLPRPATQAVPPQPKQELIDVLEDVLRWSR